MGGQLPRPLPDDDAAVRRTQHQAPPASDSQDSQVRKGLAAVLIGVCASAIGVVIMMALTFLILALVAQMIITGKP
jgi:hypothetical protein